MWTVDLENAWHGKTTRRYPTQHPDALGGKVPYMYLQYPVTRGTLTRPTICTSPGNYKPNTVPPRTRATTPKCQKPAEVYRIGLLAIPFLPRAPALTHLMNKPTGDIYLRQGRAFFFSVLPYASGERERERERERAQSHLSLVSFAILYGIGNSPFS